MRVSSELSECEARRQSGDSEPPMNIYLTPEKSPGFFIEACENVSKTTSCVQSDLYATIFSEND